MNASAARTQDFAFELFVAGDAPNSAQALANLRTLCEGRVPKRYTIEVVDVFQNPARAMQEKIFMTPTLRRISPRPERRIVGTLSHAGNVADALGLDAEAA